VNLTDSDLRQQFRKARFLPAGMRTIALPWGDVAGHHRRAARKGLPYTLDHADRLEQQLDQHPPDQATVTLSLTEDVFLRSYNWARWQLGIPLPSD
jgi:hypothetical protein